MSSSFVFSNPRNWDSIAWVHLGFGLLMIYIGVWGIIFNILSTIVYLSKRFRKVSINILLAALIVVDAFLLLLAIPTFAFVPFTNLVSGRAMDYWYKILMLYVYPVAKMSRLMSVWLLIPITIERYIAVCYPLKAAVICTRSRAVCSITVVVISGFIFNVIRFWEYGSGVGNNITFILRNDELYMKWYGTVGTMVVEYVFPLVLLSLLSWNVDSTMREAVKRRQSLTTVQANVYKTTKMMMGVIIVFVVCSTTSLILNVVELSDQDFFMTEWGSMLSDFNNLMVMFNSASTFIFYYKFSRKYRQCLRCLVSCKSLGTETHSIKGYRNVPSNENTRV